MSLPPPIIPQTAEQAIARDQIAGLSPVRLDDPRAELERLRQAIRDHRDFTVDCWLPQGAEPHKHDSKLWATLGESA